MKRYIIIVSIAAVLIGVSAGDKVLLASSYSYACWRVRHPFSSSVSAFSHVVARTTPAHIPELIERLGTQDGWWIESALRAWFPLEQSRQSDSREFWVQWWKEHQSDYQSGLILLHDPQF